MKSIIFVEWATHGRDFEIDLSLIYFFEKVLKWNVQYLSIFNLPKILSSNPDLIIMSNTIGADINTNFSKQAKENGFLLFSHVSEGLFRESNIRDMVFGRSEELYEVHSTYWSKKSYNMALKHFPEIFNKVFYTGSLSHDKYRIYSTTNQIDTRGYSKVVSYMSFDFHTLIANKEQFEKRLGKHLVSLQLKHIELINRILDELIANNSDILFLLKPHPGDGNKIPMELIGLDKYSNVNFLYNVSTVDIINSSDMVLNFQSSTNLEAWLLDKPTVTIFEDKEFFEIYEVTKGSVNISNIKDLQKIVDEFYEKGKIKLFEEKKEVRGKLIKDFIAFDDGLNHIRFMSFLKPYIEKIENGEMTKGKWKIPLRRRLKGHTQYIVYSLSKGRYKTPFLKKWAHIYGRFEEKEIEEQKRLRYLDFDKFYNKNSKIINETYNNYAIDCKKELGIK